MSSFFPTDDAPTIARNPSRSLWEAGLVGHRQAMEQVLGRCAPTIYAWMRAVGSEPDDAAARTGNFLLHVMEKEPPDPQTEDVSRLQEFLLRRLTNFAAEGFPEPGVVKGARPAFDRAQAERRFSREAAKTPDDIFTRRWALGALELTVETLTEEFTNEGKAALVPHLRQFLSFSGGEEVYAKVAEETGTSVSALHVAVYRFRQRYREVLRRLVGDTVRNPDDVDSELTKLLVSAS
jgi:DNA-directed RNA polymerase specialized sigma24 family protein